MSKRRKNNGGNGGMSWLSRLDFDYGELINFYYDDPIGL
jgi:hypothetical protein